MLVKPDSYPLFFNRDELKSHQHAIVSAVQTLHQTQVISPTDPNGDGSWITVNEPGLSLCLLNNYSATANIESRN